MTKKCDNGINVNINYPLKNIISSWERKKYCAGILKCKFKNEHHLMIYLLPPWPLDHPGVSHLQRIIIQWTCTKGLYGRARHSRRK